jgi:proliferating cell nuclear antigen
MGDVGFADEYPLPVVDTRNFHGADPDHIKQEYCFFLKTVQSMVFRTLVDAMKEIVADTNVVFDERGVLVKAMDEPQNALIHLRLHATELEEYICDGTHVCGVALLHLHRILKTMSSTDVLMLYMRRSNRNVLEIRIENNKKAKTSHYSLYLLDLQKTNIHVRSPEFPQAISIDSTEFHKIIREMKDISRSVDIQCHRNTLRFKSVKGTFAEADIHLGIRSTGDATTRVGTGAPTPLSVAAASSSNMTAADTGHGDDDDDDGGDDGLYPDVVQGVFSLKYLSQFVKCTSLSKKVHLFLKNDYPLIVQYSVSNLGTIRLVLVYDDPDV